MDLTDVAELKERILKTEVEYPRYLASWQETEYGMLFWAEDDKENPNLNHALLTPNKYRILGRSWKTSRHSTWKRVSSPGSSSPTPPAISWSMLMNSGSTDLMSSFTRLRSSCC